MAKKTSRKNTKFVTMSAFERGMDFMAKSFAKVFEKLDQHSKTLDQHSKILDQHSKTLDQHSKILDQHSKTLDQHSRVLETVLKETQNFSQEAREHRMMMSDLSRTDVVHYRKIEGLEMRIEKLEQKVK